MKAHFYAILATACIVMASIVCISAGRKPVTLFMVGDSTMADKEELDASPERGWGQLFPTYLTGNIVVQNHARNGRSTKSFIDQGRWEEVMKRAKKGDIVIIQFGHNDAKKEDPARYSTPEAYAQNLTNMVNEARAKKMHVVLCTSVNRREFAGDTLKQTLGDYPDQARLVAEELGVPLLDLESTSRQWLEHLGDEASKAYFMNVAPGECTKYPEGKIDNTHLREAGALEIGRQAAEMIVSEENYVECLAPYITFTQGVRYTTPCGVK